MKQNKKITTDMILEILELRNDRIVIANPIIS